MGNAWSISSRDVIVQPVLSLRRGGYAIGSNSLSDCSGVGEDTLYVPSPPGVPTQRSAGGASRGPLNNPFSTVCFVPRQAVLLLSGRDLSMSITYFLNLPGTTLQPIRFNGTILAMVSSKDSTVVLLVLHHLMIVCIPFSMIESMVIDL